MITSREARLLCGVVRDLRVDDAGCTQIEIDDLADKLVRVRDTNNLDGGFSALVEALLQHPSAPGINYFGDLLAAHRLEDGRFAVMWNDRGKEGEQLFTSAADAAKFFVEERERRRLGFDFEAAG